MLEELYADLMTEEDVVAWPYLDTRKNVTVGVGHRIATFDDAQDLRWLWRGQPATLAQLREGWLWLVQQPAGLVASAYRRDLILPDAQIRSLLEADVASTAKRVRGVYKGFDNYPPPAQRALLNMAFNLGVAGLILKFPHLHFAAEAGDWSECAAQCDRIGVSATRNQKTAQLFLAAA